MRTCRLCQEEKPLEMFAKNTTGRKDPYRQVCKACKNTKYNKKRYDPIKQAESARKWREANPEKDKRTRRRAAWKSKGIDPDVAEQLFNSHDGKCALCQEIIVGKPCVDHCHTTSKVRDILCNSCNSGLGYFKDSPRILLLAVDYLNRHSN